MEEGSEADVPGVDVGLVLGQASEFRFFSSTLRQQDQPGESLDWWDDDELQESDALVTTLTLPEGRDESTVPVRSQSRITELGVLELWCVGQAADDRWKLEFNVRDDAAAETE